MGRKAVCNMAKINIVLADSDELYLNHLSNYLMEHVSTLEVFAFSTKDSLIKFIGDKSNKIDVIAFTEDLMDEAVRTADIPAKVLLSDGTFSELEDFESVNKYQKAESFVKAILLIYAERTGRVEAVSTGDKNTKIIGFYSPIGGSGKTTLALSCAQILAGQGKRVFYLNAEKINSTVDVLNKADSGSLSDLYLTVKTKGANISLRIMANKYTDTDSGVSYINPAESSLEINEITPEEFRRLLTEFEALGEFDYVLVDYDSEFSKEKIKLLDKCDVIIAPITPETTPLTKIRLFIKELGMYDEFTEIKQKFVYVLNKSVAQSNAIVQSSGLAGECEIKANISISPILSDLNNIFHSQNSLGQIMSGILASI